MKGCEQLWLEEKDKIIQQLPVLLEGSQRYIHHFNLGNLQIKADFFFILREINFHEAQYLVAVLASEETPLIVGTLSVVTNLAAFSVNQEHFRVSGLNSVLPKLILSSNRPIKQKACILTANMAINEKNNQGT